MEDIFSKQVPLCFKTSDREERTGFVQLTMKLLSDKHSSKKELHVKLTDEQDLFFLYTLRLAEEDFQSLKMQQGLLMDFLAFPQKFVDLLELCIKEKYKENPKFVIHFVNGGSSVLGEGPSVMNIVETNPFRHLNHLSLKFIPGSDADIKSHLATCLKQMKESNNLIQHKYEHTSQDLSSKLSEAQEHLSAKSAELESLKLEWSSRISDITSKFKEDMALEKEKTVQFQSSLQVRFERERRELEQAHSKLIKQLEARLDEYETNNRDLTDRKYKSESSIRDYKSRLATLEEECNRMKTELHSFRKENTSLENARQEKEKLISQLQTRVAVLEQELKDKAEVLTQSNDLLGSERDKKKHLETEIEQRQKEIGKLESKVKAMGDELKKGNEIIKKLQGEIKAYHAKVKLRTQIATEQEKLLGEKDSELEKLRQDLAATKDRLRETEEKNQNLNCNLETATQKLEESRKLLKTNENMIQWLNKQINEQKVSKSHLGNFEHPTSGHIQSRPAVAIHNYSTSSYASALSQETLRQHQTSQRFPAPVPLGSHQSLIEHHCSHPSISNSGSTNSTTIKKNAIPVSQGPSNSSSTLPETFCSSAVDKEKNPPLDPKFLMKRDEAVPVRGILNYNNASSRPAGSSFPQSSTINSSVAQTRSGGQVPPAISAASSASAGGYVDVGSIRLSQQMIIPKQQAPLASAYFPSHS